MVDSVNVANLLINENFFIVSPNPRGHLQVQDQRGFVVCPLVTYDSPNVSDLLSYWDKARRSVTMTEEFESIDIEVTNENLRACFLNYFRNTTLPEAIVNSYFVDLSTEETQEAKQKILLAAADALFNLILYEAIKKELKC